MGVTVFGVDVTVGAVVGIEAADAVFTNASGAGAGVPNSSATNMAGCPL